jgi:hypothetical protein
MQRQKFRCQSQPQCPTVVPIGFQSVAKPWLIDPTGWAFESHDNAGDGPTCASGTIGHHVRQVTPLNSKRSNAADAKTFQVESPSCLGHYDEILQ